MGLRPESVALLGRTKGWLHYRLPKRFIRKTEDRLYRPEADLVFCFVSQALSDINLAAHDDLSSITGSG